MKALFLAGGYGTRLYPLTLRIPKVMVPVAGKPVLEHLVRVCKNAGVEEIVVSLNKNQRVVEEYFGDGSKWGVHIEYAYEESAGDEDKLGAIGAIQHALKATGVPKECVVMAGDNVFYGLDLQRMHAFHKQSGAKATIALYSLNDAQSLQQYGIAEVDKSGRITRFREKPGAEEIFSNKVATGLYHLEESFLQEYLPAYVQHHKAKGQKADRLGDLWQHFLKEVPLYGHAFQGMWGDTNNAKTYVETHKQAMQFIKGSVPKEVECAVHNPATTQISGKKISCDAFVKGPCIIEEECVVEEGAVVGNGTHLMKGVEVRRGAVVNGSIVFRECVIEENARVTDSVLDIGVRVGEKAVVEPHSIIGYKAEVGSAGRVLNESRVWPFCEIGAGAIVGGDVMVAESLFKQKIGDRLY